MNALDLQLEMTTAAAAMTLGAFDHLAQLCGSGSMPHRRWLASLLGAGAIGTAQVTVSRAGWEPGGPDRRLLLAVHDAAGELIDIAAIASHRRDEWALRTGTGWALGMDLIEAAQARSLAEQRTTLRLFASPFDWLAAQGEGICVLDWCAASLAELRLLGERVTIETDPGAGERLKAMLAHGGLPRVREVQTQQWERAA